MKMNLDRQYVPLRQFLDQCGDRPTGSGPKAGIYIPSLSSDQTIHSETHPLLAVEFPSDGGAIVHLFDRNAPGIRIHFTGPNGAAEKIVVANAGLSGECAYNPSLQIIAKFAGVVRANPDSSIAGNVISSFATALGVRNVNVYDSRPGYSTSEWAGAKKGIGEIQAALAEQAGHFFSTPALLAARAAQAANARPAFKG